MKNYREKLAQRIEKNVSSRRAANLRKIIPDIDYGKLLQCGVSSKNTALIHALCDDAPLFSLRNDAYFKERLLKNSAAVAWLLTHKEFSGESMCAVTYWKNGGRLSRSPLLPFDIESARGAIDSEFNTASQAALYKHYSQDVSFKPITQLPSVVLPVDMKCAMWANGYADTTALRAALYEHYGHDVSFKPITFMPPDAVRLINKDWTVDLLGFTPHLPTAGWYRFFKPGDLEETVRQPSIQAWHEAELKKIKSQECIKAIKAVIEKHGLKVKPTLKLLDDAFHNGELRTAGTAIADVLPPTSLFGGEGRARAKKKELVANELKALFENFYSMGVEFHASDIQIKHENELEKSKEQENKEEEELEEDRDYGMGY